MFNVDIHELMSIILKYHFKPRVILMERFMFVVLTYYLDLADKGGLEWSFIRKDKVCVPLLSYGHSSGYRYIQVILLVKNC